MYQSKAMSNIFESLNWNSQLILVQNMISKNILMANHILLNKEPRHIF